MERPVFLINLLAKRYILVPVVFLLICTLRSSLDHILGANLIYFESSKLPGSKNLLHAER